MTGTERVKRIRALNAMLLEDMPRYRKEAESFPENAGNQRRLLRSLMNLRPPGILSPEYLRMQDELLQAEREEKGIVRVDGLPGTATDDRIILWQGDITRLDADAIVNAANSQLLGCFYPCHGCIDNAIHSAAGLGLREECDRIMQELRRQDPGYEEPTGSVKVTSAYNLPSRYVFHTVGPIIYHGVQERDRELLVSCYRSCLAAAEELGLESIAFCCISTGEFRFPNREAAELAVKTVQEFLEHNTTIKKVIFNVFKDLDAEIYRELLG